MANAAHQIDPLKLFWTNPLPVASGGTGGTTAPTARTNLGFADGTYLPIVTGKTNITSSIAYPLQYMRIGNTVTVSGRVTANPIVVLTFTQLNITLPFASASIEGGTLGGSSFCDDVAGLGAAFLKDTNGEAVMQWVPSDSAERNYWFSFTYLIT